MSDQNFYVTEDVLTSKNNRFVNHLIDLIPQYAIMYGISYSFLYLGEFTGNYTLNNYWAGLSQIENLLYSYILMLLYFFIFESINNRTLGKYVTKSMVIMSNGEKPTYQQIFKRSLCRMIPFDGLSFLGANGKGWHDSMSNTYVVDIAKYNERFNALNSLDQIGVSQEEY
jgi:uncharacterized RDD family membrane protein YckC